jgi:hypothetical protein
MSSRPSPIASGRWTALGQCGPRGLSPPGPEQKVVREIMVFLHSHGVGTARAVPSFGARRLLRVSWEYQAHIGAVAAALKQLLVDPRSIAAMTPRAVRSKIAASK